jgi:hypothetical protein
MHVGAFEISNQAWRLWADVDVPDVRRLVMPMELRLESGSQYFGLTQHVNHWALN